MKSHKKITLINKKKWKSKSKSKISKCKSKISKCKSKKHINSKANKWKFAQLLKIFVGGGTRSVNWQLPISYLSSNPSDKLCENCPSVNRDSNGILLPPIIDTYKDPANKSTYNINESKPHVTTYESLDKLKGYLFPDLMNGGGWGSTKPTFPDLMNGGGWGSTRSGEEGIFKMVGKGWGNKTYKKK